MKWTFAFTLLVVLIAQGCTPKASFELSVTNRTDQPITVGIVKEGGSYERDLAGPEQWALESSLDSLPPWGHVIPPGKTLNSPEITGSFPRGSAAYLRIYRGQRSNAGLMAISNPSPDRLEVLLFPGYNQLIVHNELNKGLVAQRLHPQRQQ